MMSERVQRHIDRLLDAADQAMVESNWAAVRDHARDTLAIDPENRDALTFLAAAERRLGDLGTALAGAPTLAPPRTPTPEPTLAQPASFAGGRYQVRRFLGEGGKKKVYLAHDNRLDRDVAFALIKTQGLDDEGIARITREAQAMGRLGDHPYIVSVFDIGEERISSGGQDEKQPYLVTQLMGGGDVEGLIEKAEGHKLPLERALTVAGQMCQALEHAHTHGIVHRDLKPGNVWLTDDGTAKLGDFGLAVSLDRSRLTQAGMMVGTVSYMPPEQAIGGTVEPRSDLYSLGAMLYEMVAGRPPFIGDESVAIITQHLNTPPVAPTWHRPDCPPALETLILRLLEKDPAKRPASAAEVRQALVAVDLSALLPSPAAAVSAGDSPRRGEGLGVGSSPLYRRTFVGREPELKQLQQAFDQALSGHGSLVMVVGEPGIGKTALIEQLATYAAVRGGTALVGHAYEEGSLSLPYLAFVEALRSYVLQRPADSLKEELGTGAADVARIVSEIRDRVTVELRPQGEPEEDRWRLLQAVTGFLRAASRVQPLVVVLEDLHWADRGTLDLLTHAARSLEGARLLIVGTYRDVEVDRAHPLAATLAELRRSSSFSRVLLRGLTPDEVHRMLNALTTQEVRWAMAEAVHRQTEGNPLFIQEVVRYLVEEGIIHRDGTRWVRTGETPPEMSIPEGLREVIGRRLSRLSAEANRLLAIAAVIGRDFSLPTLETVAALPEEQVLSYLEEALRVGVLEDRSRAGDVRYRFAHAFFRQTLYEEMITPRRLRMHQQVAQALEAQYAARLEEHAAELAEHFSQSSDPAELAKAVRYAEMAAGRAMAVYAYSEAARLLEQALQVQEVLDPNDQARRCDLLLALSEALYVAGEPQRVYEQTAEEAFALAEALEDRARAFRSSQIAWEAMNSFGAATMNSTPVARRWVERGDRYASAGTRERVAADLAMVSVQREAGQEHEAQVLRIRALDLARQLDDPAALFEVIALVTQSGPPQRWEERLQLTREASGAPRAGLSARTQSGLLYYGGINYLAAGERAKAEECWVQLAELATRVRYPRTVLLSLGAEGALALVDGQVEAAAALGKHLVDRGDELGSPVFGRQFGASLSLRPLLYLGRAEEALAFVPLALQSAGVASTALFGQAGVAAGRRALCLAHLGRLDEGRAALHDLLARAGIGSAEGETPSVLLVLLLETAVLVRDHAAAALLASRLTGIASLATESSLVLTSPARHLGAAAALLGRRDEARGFYNQGLAAAQTIRFRPEIALIRLGMAELLLDEAEDAGTMQEPPRRTAADRRREANEHLDFAIAEFREMKMQPSLERALRHKGFLKA